MDLLTDDATGQFVVATESGSRYVLDLDRRVLRRAPGPVFQELRRLRRDGESIDLIEIVECRIGHRMVLRIDLNAPGVLVTTRISTAVVRIDPLPT
ncbi:hypothetical protein [Cryobacterium glucosi]|uniref:Uncharacterized protein n=1 Tax=Cryobacterium glucosi TaxID=1259175 RepID=A0ABY2IHN8_9MICO|nr:hypothetical protein [Cryobacterium glucosi]TFC16541.1 hypothetical protein E3O46_17975 [Cryobacterium glucosi]